VGRVRFDGSPNANGQSATRLGSPTLRMGDFMNSSSGIDVDRRRRGLQMIGRSAFGFSDECAGVRLKLGKL